jgi:hypothetical protein
MYPHCDGAGSERLKLPNPLIIRSDHFAAEHHSK